MTDPRTALVAAGYDATTDTWESWKAGIRDDPRDHWCAELVRLLDDAELELLRNEVVGIRDPEGDATFHWVLARR